MQVLKRGRGRPRLNISNTERRLLEKERNKKSAAKYRAKKHGEQENLIYDEKKLLEKNIKLKYNVKKLEQEVENVRKELTMKYVYIVNIL